MSKCQFETCEREVLARSLCGAHYSQQRSGKTLSPVRERLPKITEWCSFTDCAKPVTSKGLCAGHYEQRRLGKDLAPLQVPVETCTFDGCNKPHSAHGLCDGHDIQRREGRPLTELRRREAGRSCTATGCGLPLLARDMCMRHYNEWHWAESPLGREARTRAAQRRRAVRLGADTREVPARDWNRLVALYDGMCAYCRDNPWEHRDHIIPLSRGGRHSIGNLLPACATCNTKKKDRLNVEWIRVAA